VITADEVDTLLFDVLGIVVDEAGSMREELRAALDQVGAALCRFGELHPPRSAVAICGRA
jgi:hypothetical protein